MGVSEEDDVLPGRGSLLLAFGAGVGGLESEQFVLLSLATDSPARSAQEPAMSEGMNRLLPLVDSSGWVTLGQAEKSRTLPMRGAAVWGRPWWGC